MNDTTEVASAGFQIDFLPLCVPKNTCVSSIKSARSDRCISQAVMLALITFVPLCAFPHSGYCRSKWSTGSNWSPRITCEAPAIAHALVNWSERSIDPVLFSSGSPWSQRC